MNENNSKLMVKGENIRLLLEILKVFGINTLTDTSTKIFNYKLKESADFIDRLKVFEPEIKQLYGLDDKFTDVDASVKILKKILDKLEIGYKCGRTAKSSYISLLNEQANSDDNNYESSLINDYVVKYSVEEPDIQTYRNLQPNYHTLIKYLRPILKKEPNAYTDKEVSCVKFRMGYICPMICIVLDMTQPNINVVNCINSLSSTRCIYQFAKSFINSTKVFIIFELKRVPEKQNEPDIPELDILKLEFNDTYYDYKVNDFSLIAECISYSKPRTFNFPTSLIDIDTVKIQLDESVGMNYVEFPLNLYSYVKGIYSQRKPERVVIKASPHSDLYSYDTTIIKLISNDTNNLVCPFSSLTNLLPSTCIESKSNNIIVRLYYSNLERSCCLSCLKLQVETYDSAYNNKYVDPTKLFPIKEYDIQVGLFNKVSYGPEKMPEYACEYAGPYNFIFQSDTLVECEVMTIKKDHMTKFCLMIDFVDGAELDLVFKTDEYFAQVVYGVPMVLIKKELIDSVLYLVYEISDKSEKVYTNKCELYLNPNFPNIHIKSIRPFYEFGLECGLKKEDAILTNKKPRTSDITLSKMMKNNRTYTLEPAKDNIHLLKRILFNAKPELVTLNINGYTRDYPIEQLEFIKLATNSSKYLLNFSLDELDIGFMNLHRLDYFSVKLVFHQITNVLVQYETLDLE